MMTAAPVHWSDAATWAAVIDAEPSAEGRARLVRERCLAAGAGPAMIGGEPRFRLTVTRALTTELVCDLLDAALAAGGAPPAPPLPPRGGPPQATPSPL